MTGLIRKLATVRRVLTGLDGKSLESASLTMSSIESRRSYLSQYQLPTINVKIVGGRQQGYMLFGSSLDITHATGSNQSRSTVSRFVARTELVLSRT